jgi:hypothetical protein
MNATQTSIRSNSKGASQHRLQYKKHNRTSSRTSNAGGPMTEQERQLCELSRIITALVDSTQQQRVLNAVQSCIRTQTCLSSQKF